MNVPPEKFRFTERTTFETVKWQMAQSLSSSSSIDCRMVCASVWCDMLIPSNGQTISSTVLP